MYAAYREYFRKSRGDEDAQEPSSTVKLREGLLDAVWEAILIREDIGADDALVNGTYAPGGRPVTNLETLYAFAFKRLIKSSRRWRGRDGAKGYINMLNEFVF